MKLFLIGLLCFYYPPSLSFIIVKTFSSFHHYNHHPYLFRGDQNKNQRNNNNSKFLFSIRPSSSCDDNENNNNFDEESFSTEDKNVSSDEEILEKSRDWLERIVVGWNLCPFAARPNREGSLHYIVVRGSNTKDILARTMEECLVLVQQNEKTTTKRRRTTTLVIAPDCYPNNFMDYLDVYTILTEDLIPQYDDILDGRIQIASFHPLFEFESDDGSDSSFWTNRSPFPMFHILREIDVSNAVNKLSNNREEEEDEEDDPSEKVWQRNIQVLKDIQQVVGGEMELQTIIRDKKKNSDENKKSIQQILQKYPILIDPKSSSDIISKKKENNI